MTDAYVQLAVDGAGKKVDASELTVNSQTVERQRVVLAGDSGAAALAPVGATPPAPTDYGLSVRDTGDNYQVFSGQATATGVLFSGDTAGFQSFSIENRQSSGPTLTVEHSSDNVNWTGSQVYIPGAGSGVQGNPWHNQPPAGLSIGRLSAKFWRLRCTAYSSTGTGNLVVVFHKKPIPTEALSVTNAVSVTLSYYYNTTSISLSAVAAVTTLTFNANATCGFQITSLGVGGTLIVEGTNDGGTNWFPMDAYPATDGAARSIVDAPGVYLLAAAPVQIARLRVLTLTSGTISGNTWVNAQAMRHGRSYMQPTAPAKQVGVTNWIKSAASTNAVSVKASAGNVQGFLFTNNAAYAVFVKLYDKASAPTVGTDTPVTAIGIPAGGNVQFTPIHALPFFTTGIAYAITKAVADSDTTAVAANDLTGFLLTA